ncbi:hypothetical protein FQN54_000391 [Arachnomyces sp. PD_36]|nr:hypothetical protein FQN54_000391 [Arachnomyces sp. PD_36]
MAPIDIPTTGLSLRPERPDTDNTSTSFPPGKSQIMRLNLAQSTLDELVDSLRNDQKARIRLGKHQSLHYGKNKSQQLFSSPSPQRSELYLAPSADRENMYFSGVLSHNLEVEKAKEATAATDEALANLEQSMSAFERGKESKKTHLLADIQEVRALGAGDSRSSNGRKAALLARMPTSKIDVEKERFFKGAADRSLSASPLLGGSKSPASMPFTPTSAPLARDKEKIRLDALRTPFIHLLAVRSVSAKFLAQQTRASLEDCQALAQKVGVENRLNREKFDLRDKVYKDLDVWNFPYPSQDDRQEAINNAISAFDRMRISRSDKLWQMLLPKNERGKGKVLSRLNLSNGPMKKSVTPRINVQPSEDTGKEGDGAGNETDRMNGATTPNRGDLMPPARTTGPTQKKKAGDKEAPKRTPPKSKNNTTLTGKVTKKTDKKGSGAGKTDGKFKSAEYVQDSDSDEEMEDVPIPEKQPEAPAKAKAPAAPKPAKVVKTQETKASKPKPTAPNPKVPIPSTESKPTKGPARELPADARGRSNSAPRKPSPLGSSPPTNASDFENGGRPSNANTSSSSSSPLITQRQKEGAPKAKLPAKPNGVSGPPPHGSLKRKAETAASNSRVAGGTNNVSRPVTNGRANGPTNDPKRRRISSATDSVSSSSSGGSTSPPLSCEIRRRELQEKSRQFKRYYAKYRALHEEMSTHPNPPRSQVERLERQHSHLQNMKEEIWDEDRRLAKMGV